MLNTLHAFDAVCSWSPRIGRWRPLRGRFSAIETIRDATLEGSIIVESQAPGPFYAGSITEKVGLRQHDLQPWPVFWCHDREARLAGSALHWRNSSDEICVEGAFHRTKRRRLMEDRLLAQSLLGSPQVLTGAWTSLVSNWGGGTNYYHWMLDCLTRLLVREHLPEPTKILIPTNSHKFVHETICMLGIENECMEAPSDHLIVESFYFCSPTAMTGAWNPRGYTWIRDKFRPFFNTIDPDKRIFLTRRGSSRVPKNINTIEKIFLNEGFEIIECGSLAVKDQIALASKSSAIAGLHGAAMTNILWAAPHTPVLELFQANYLNSCFEQIAHQGDLDYSYHIMDETSDTSAIEKWIQISK